MSARPDWNAGLLAAQPLPWLPHCQTALVESRGPGGTHHNYNITYFMMTLVKIAFLILNNVSTLHYFFCFKFKIFLNFFDM